MDISGSAKFVSLIKLMPEVETEYAIEALGGSETAYEDILMRIVRLIPSNIENMDSFLNTANNLRDFKVKVHGMKSSLRQVGNLKLARYAEDLEEAAIKGDKLYCTEHYNLFREKLLGFFDKVNAAFSECNTSEGSAETEHACNCNIYDFCDILAKVKEAAESYDTMSAAELLAPLTKRRFGESADKSIASAMEALYVFKPTKALEYLNELEI